jgi:hypothetical protein
LIIYFDTKKLLVSTPGHEVIFCIKKALDGASTDARMAQVALDKTAEAFR